MTANIDINSNIKQITDDLEKQYGAEAMAQATERGNNTIIFNNARQALTEEYSAASGLTPERAAANIIIQNSLGTQKITVRAPRNITATDWHKANRSGSAPTKRGHKVSPANATRLRPRTFKGGFVPNSAYFDFTKKRAGDARLPLAQLFTVRGFFTKMKKAVATMSPDIAVKTARAILHQLDRPDR